MDWTIPRTLERAHLYWVHWFSCKVHPSALTDMPEIMRSLISGLTCDLLTLTHKINLHMKQLLGRGFPGDSDSKESVCNARDSGSIPGPERSPGEGKGCPLQYSGLENSMDCIVHGVAKSQTRLSNFHFTYTDFLSFWLFFQLQKQEMNLGCKGQCHQRFFFPSLFYKGVMF